MGDPVKLVIEDAEYEIKEIVRNDRVDRPTVLYVKMLKMIVTLAEAIRDAKS